MESLSGGESKLKGLWQGYFEQLMNNEAEGEAVVTSMGIEAGRGLVPMQREIGWLEVEEAIARLKCGKAAGMDGITAEMLKYGGDAVVEWMLICERAWKNGEVAYQMTGRKLSLYHCIKVKAVGVSVVAIGG